jgi:hypothetical protein
MISRGYGREAHGFTKSKQAAAFRREGLVPDEMWWNDEMDDMLDHGLRDSDMLKVWRVAVLAEPKRHKGDALPRRKLRAVINRLKEIGVTVYEIETKRTCTDPDAILDMVFDAVEHLAGQKKQRSRGRPAWQKPSLERYEAARAIWHNSRDYDTNEAALTALDADPERFGGPWTVTRCYREFGASGRPLKGRRAKTDTSR